MVKNCLPVQENERHRFDPWVEQRTSSIMRNEYNMHNAGMDEALAGIRIVGRNINNLRYADDTTLMPKAKRNEITS